MRPDLGSYRGPRLILIQISGSCMLGEPFLCWICPLTCPEALVPDLLLCFAPDQLSWGRLWDLGWEAFLRPKCEPH